MTDWWREFYEQLHEIWPAWSLSPADSMETVDFLTGWLGLSGTERVLDLGCGVGREVVEFGLRGHECVGVDISPKLIELARGRAYLAGVTGGVQLLQGDFRTFRSDDRFDLALFWDSTLNVYGLPQARSALRKLAPLVRPGGWVVVEQLSRDYWEGRRERMEIQADEVGPGRTVRRCSYRKKTKRFIDRLIYFAPGSDEGRELPVQSLRLFSPDELRSIFAKAGLMEVELVFSDGGHWTAASSASLPSQARRVCARGRRPVGS